jgi:hypothetical protein
MANVDYSAFFPYLIPLVPHVADPVAEQAVRSACIEFCKESLIWQAPIDPISSQKGEGVYELDVPTGANLAHVVDLYYSESRLWKKSISEIASHFSRNWMMKEGTPTVFTMLNPNEVTLVMKPDKSVTDALTGILAFTPLRKSTQIIDFILEEYAEEIAHGAASRLMAIPNQQWSEPKAAMVYRKQFLSDCANARAHVNQGQVRAPISVHMRRFW